MIREECGMIIQEYIRKIYNAVQAEEDYDKYIYVFREYISYLESVLKEEPTNIKAVCQLAIAYYEDRRDCDDVISLLEETVTKFENVMSSVELCEILNDLAYFYFEEHDNSQKAVTLLERAVFLNTPYIQTYYALANLYLAENTEASARMFNKLLELKPNNKEYRYQLGYCFLKNGKFEKALSIFKPIAVNWNDANELPEKAYFCCALAFLSMGQKTEAEKIADDLYNKWQDGRAENIDAFKLIDLFYCLEDYPRVIDLFKLSEHGLHFSKNELPIIFYSMHRLGKDKECEKVFEAKKREFDELIDTYQKDDIYTPDEKKEIITFFEKELELLKNDFHSVIELNIKPDIIDIFNGLEVPIYCFLIDCPRHYDYFSS